MKVHLHGGLDIYFSSSTLTIPNLDISTLNGLIVYLQNTYPKQEIFENGILKPGHLCIINETDYEMYEDKEIVLKEDDEIYFISTMHGG